MKFLIELSTLVFILGNAAVFGGFFHQRNEKSKNITSGMFLGAMFALAGYLAAVLLTKVEYDAVAVEADVGRSWCSSPSARSSRWVKRNDRKSDPLTWWIAGDHRGGDARDSVHLAHLLIEA